MVILMKVKFVWNTKNSMPDFVSIRVKSGNLGIEPSADQVQSIRSKSQLVPDTVKTLPKKSVAENQLHF